MSRQSRAEQCGVKWADSVRVVTLWTARPGAARSLHAVHCIALERCNRTGREGGEGRGEVIGRALAGPVVRDNDCSAREAAGALLRVLNDPRAPGPGWEGRGQDSRAVCGRGLVRIIRTLINREPWLRVWLARRTDPHPVVNQSLFGANVTNVHKITRPLLQNVIRIRNFS